MLYSLSVCVSVSLCPFHPLSLNDFICCRWHRQRGGGASLYVLIIITINKYVSSLCIVAEGSVLFFYLQSMTCNC